MLFLFYKFEFRLKSWKSEDLHVEFNFVEIKFHPMSSIEQLLWNLQFDNKNCLISFSGGQDSINFLVLLSRFQKLSLLGSVRSTSSQKARCIWCHHLWKKQDFYRLRHSLQINFILNQQFFYTIFFSKKFREQTARRSRYYSFWRVAQYIQSFSLFTAHTQTDKIETFFLHLFRGAGVLGLRALRDSQTFFPYECSTKFYDSTS